MVSVDAKHHERKKKICYSSLMDKIDGWVLTDVVAVNCWVLTDVVTVNCWVLTDVVTVKCLRID